MVSGVVLATLTRIAACAELVHGQGQCLVGLYAESSETHGSRHEVLDDGVDRLYLVEGRRCCSFLPSHEIANEDRAILFIDERCPLLELRVAAQAGGELQTSNRLGVPGMPNAVLTPREQSMIGELGTENGVLSIGNSHARLTQPNGIACNLLQSDAANGAHVRTEISSQQVLAESYALENLRTPIASDGRDAHLRHNLLQPFVNGFDIVLFSSFIVLLDLPPLHKVVEDGEGHVRAQGAGSIAKQQGGMHGLTNLAALHDKRCLDALADADEIVMNGRDG